MKKNLIFLSFVMFTSHIVTAQEKRELNWQDFVNSVKTTTMVEPVKIGKFTIFQITDINKFLYKVEIAGSVFELQTPIPTELQNLFRLTPQQLEQRANENKVKDGAEEVSEQAQKMIEVKNELDNGKGGNSEKVKELKQTMTMLTRACDEYYKLSSSLAGAVFAMKASRNKLIMIAASDRAFSKIKAMTEEVELPNFDAIKRDYQRLQELYYKVEANYNEAEKRAEQAAANESDVNRKKELEDFVKKIKEASNGVEEADKLISDEALLGLVNDVEYLYSELQNKNNFLVVSPPAQMDGDLISYKVDITPSKTAMLGSNKSPMQFKFDIPAKGGLKVDFGVGPAISFGQKAKNDNYYLKTDYAVDGRPNSPDSVGIAKLTNKNVISPGIAAMMHIYSRSGKWSGVGGAFGVGAGFQGASDVNLNIYAGLSLVMGKREKVMLSGGIGWLRVSRIKEDQYREYTSKLAYDKATLNLADLTEKVYKGSFFLCITYNLTNRFEIK
jgi:hypothetical protein